MKNLFVYILICYSSLLYGQPVLSGDYPDPSVVKINGQYWATATSSNWAPAFPLLSSPDLINWQHKGYIFDVLPTWADYYFWAPEISFDKGKVFVYYSAHKKDGSLCVAAASADQPQGPYQDHGPLICQPVGSIDGFATRDEQGKLYLIWKEDGNSVGKPTPIWAMQMSEDRKKLIGEKKQLMVNDQPWEGNLIEGMSVIRHGRFFYAFYSANACCGKSCNYNTGIARSEKLLGPWEKYSGNPVLTGDDQWKCPGHGTPVEKDGKFFFLYHAYDNQSDVFTGRQGLLREFRFTDDNWIAFVDKTVGASLEELKITDEFKTSTLDIPWQWSVFQKPVWKIEQGRLSLIAQGGSPVFVGQKLPAAHAEARTVLIPGQTEAEGGIAAIGDEKNLITLTYLAGKLSLWKMDEGKQTVLEEKAIQVPKTLVLRVNVKDGNRVSFDYSTDGKSFTDFHREAIDALFIPPWDRSIRLGVLARGPVDQKVSFENFALHGRPGGK